MEIIGKLQENGALVGEKGVYFGIGTVSIQVPKNMVNVAVS